MDLRHQQCVWHRCSSALSQPLVLPLSVWLASCYVLDRLQGTFAQSVTCVLLAVVAPASMVLDLGARSFADVIQASVLSFELAFSSHW